MKRKRWLLFVVVLIVSLGSICASARYSYTDQIDAGFAISGNVASCSGNVEPSETTHTASVVVKLQKKVNSSWSTVKSWSASASKAGSTASASGTYTLSKGFQYRVYVIGTVRDSSGTVLETTYRSSAIKQY